MWRTYRASVCVSKTALHSQKMEELIVIKRRSTFLCVAILIITVGIPSFAGVQEPTRVGQGAGAPQRGAGAGRGNAAPPTNLQVLPKDWTRQQVVQVMQGFTMGLGVMCNYCHTEMAGAQPGPNGQIPLDAASDDKQAKKTARVMMRLVNDINSKLDSELGKSTSAPNAMRVQCVTCHRGSAVPKTQ